ncbi:ABC transporter ATP-binding protein [Mycoplasmatota bacterium]|nr:ABC transporter ATP-binding protein [Mycoplasmatota bacterium]
MIKIEGLSQKFGNKVAVDNVNLDIADGGIIGLIGPNGSGKSTIIRSVMGILKPTSGRVLVDDQLVDRKISEKIAYMSDVNDLYLPTVQDNIDYFTQLYKDYDVDLVMNIISSLNIDFKMNVKGLSKGQCVIIRFALTVGRKVDYILFDEPLSGLDPVFRESFIDRLMKFRKDNPKVTIIITSHMLNEIQDLLDHVIAIYFAEILAYDTKDNILKDNTDLETWFKDQYVKAGITF